MSFIAKPNTFAFIGHSSSPKGAVILAVSGDLVRFRTYPYRPGGEQQMQRRHFEILAETGCKTEIARLKRALALFPVDGKTHSELLAQVDDMERALRGDAREVNPVDYERVQWVVRYSGPRSGDPWYFAEEYGGVGGIEIEGRACYHICGSISAMRECLQSGEWELLGFKNE